MVSAMTRSGRSVARRRTALLAVGGLLWTLMLTACSAIPGLDKTPSVSAEAVTPTPTVKPSPSPVLPAGAKKDTNSGGIAFAKHWFAAYNHATWSLTSAELKPISDPACVFCTRAETTVDQLKAAGHTAEGGRVTVTNAKVAVGTPKKGLRVNIVYDQAASTIRDSNGAVVTTKPAVKAGQLAVAAKWTGKQWVVLEVVIF
jgi:hypothetical protein